MTTIWNNRDITLPVSLRGFPPSAGRTRGLAGWLGTIRSPERALMFPQPWNCLFYLLSFCLVSSCLFCFSPKNVPRNAYLKVHITVFLLI